MIEIKLTFATPEDAADAMLKLAGQDYSPTETAATAPTAAPVEEPAPKPRATRKPKAEVVDTPTAEDKGNISSTPEDRQDPENPDDGEADNEPAPAVEMTKEEIEEAIGKRIRPALSNYMKVFGQAAARDFLAKFQGRTPETAKLSDIEPARFAEWEQAIEAAIAAKEGA